LYNNFGKGGDADVDSLVGWYCATRSWAGNSNNYQIIPEEEEE
jgi:hypothetical protein